MQTSELGRLSIGKGGLPFGPLPLSVVGHPFVRVVSVPQTGEFLNEGSIEPVVATNDHLGIDGALPDGGIGRSTNVMGRAFPGCQGFR